MLKSDVLVEARFTTCIITSHHLKKEPEFILLHVGTNDTPYKSSEEVLVELLQLKDHIESILPGTTVILPQPTIRADNSKANYTIKQLNEIK